MADKQQNGNGDQASATVFATMRNWTKQYDDFLDQRSGDDHLNSDDVNVTMIGRLRRYRPYILSTFKVRSSKSSWHGVLFNYGRW